VNAEYSMQKMVLGGEIFGFQSVTDDKDAGQPNEVVRDAMRARTSAGTARFYSIDPNVIDSNFYLKFDVSPKWNIWGAAGMTLSGSNYSNGFHFEAGMKYAFGGTPSKPAPTTRDKKVEKFKEDTNDGVDQKMFRPTPTKPPPPPAKKKVNSTQQLQNQMDDVEMEIELKTAKKKKR
jgi:hypothetical protein